MPELLGDAAGVVDVGHRAATGVAVAAPQPHRHADDVVAGIAAARAAATDESTPPLSATSTFIARTPACAGGDTASTMTTVAARSTSAAVVVSPSVSRKRPGPRSVGTPIAASTCDGSIAPLAHADAALAHTPASSSRYSKRLVLDALDADVRRAGDLVRRGDRLVDVVERRSAGRRRDGRGDAADAHVLGRRARRR